MSPLSCASAVPASWGTGLSTWCLGSVMQDCLRFLGLKKEESSGFFRNFGHFGPAIKV